MIQDIVIVVVKNSSTGKLYVHQRRDDKKVFPSLYGFGAGGKVDPLEEIEVAAVRELREELGINGVKLERLFDFLYPPREEVKTHNITVFGLDYSGEITPCTREFQRADWMNPSDIERLIEGEDLCPDSVIIYNMMKVRSYF